MKTFKQHLTEAPKTWSLADFKTIIASSQELEAFDVKAGENLRERYLPRLVDALNQNASGDVPNPVFLSVKDTANHVAEIATKYPARIYAIIRGNRDINSYDYNVSNTFVVPGKLKKVQTALKKADDDGNKQFLTWLASVLTELLPLATAVEDHEDSRREASAEAG